MTFIRGAAILSSACWEIVELTTLNLELAAELYAKGLLMEDPPGSTEPFEELLIAMRLHLQAYRRQPQNRHIWLAKKSEVFIGLLDFYHKPDELFVRFLCAIPPSQGTGTRLIQHLAAYALANQINVIKTTVSSIDSRALKFYFEHLGFQKTSLVQEEGFNLHLASVEPKRLLARLLKK